MKNDNPVLNYSNYLELDKILTAQHPQSNSLLTLPVHDEMLFIVIHQVYELWFHQIRHELGSVGELLQKDSIDDNTDDMMHIVQRLERTIKILKLLNQQFDILETMQPLDFLEFRGLLGSASGFQSTQFRIIEAMLGLSGSKRHDPTHYKHKDTGGFNEEEHNEISQYESGATILHGLKRWLHRMPFLDMPFWSEYTTMYPIQIDDNAFLSDYLGIYTQLQKESKDNIVHSPVPENQKAKAIETYNKSITDFRKLFIEIGTDSFSSREMTAALFIMLYRDLPLMRLPFKLMDSLIAIDEQLSMWRYRHFLTVKKMIGTKLGTGGSAGAEYLGGTLQKNNVFNDLTILATYFIEKDKLPVLPTALNDVLTFNSKRK